MKEEGTLVVTETNEPVIAPSAPEKKTHERRKKSRERVRRRLLLPGAVDPALVKRIEGETSLWPIVCHLLAQRGFSGKDEIRRFLRPVREHMHDPFLMKDMDKAVARLVQAREKGEKILVHGDYDVDGVTSTALYVKVLRKLGFNIAAFVPHRMKDGYGVAVRGLDHAIEQDCRLVLTCDTGITAAEQVRHAQETLGLDIIVTDHHQQGKVLPNALAVVNPHRHDCAYPFKPLCGAGVAYKVLQALVRTLGEDEATILDPHLDLVGLGTICDIVPLTGENRVLAKLGLDRLRKTTDVGLLALFETAKLPSAKIDEEKCGFAIGPRLNAIGRIDDALIGLSMLLAEDLDSARMLAAKLQEANETRKKMTLEIAEAAVKDIEERGNFDDLWGIVVFLPDAHHGVVGIVASKLVERYSRPAFIMAPDEATGLWKGSGRAPDGKKLALVTEKQTGVLDECEKYLKAYGGHRKAAGATLAQPDEAFREEFRRAFNEAARKQMTEEERIPAIRTDIEVRLDDLSFDLLKQLRWFAPFGEANPSVQMVARNVLVAEQKLLGKVKGEENTLRLTLRQGKDRFSAICFFVKDRQPHLLDVEAPYYADVVFVLDENVFNGEVTLQPKITDVQVLGAADKDSLMLHGSSADRHVKDGRITATPASRRASLPKPSNSGGIPASELFS